MRSKSLRNGGVPRDVLRVVALGVLLAAAAVNAPAQDTPLHWAARHGHVDVAEGLLANGASIEVSNTLQRTPLHLAVTHPQMIRVLIQNGADVNAADALGNTPLHLAVRYDGEVSLLLELGASANARNYLGDTPLEIAVRKGNTRRNLEVVSALIEAGATNEIR
jgi:ankyrin repeat protein